MENYDVDYFIKKFEAIPEERWIIGEYCNGYGSFCAYGHCGFRGDKNRTTELSTEGNTLGEIFKQIDSIVHEVNDGDDSKYKQHSPKQRILAALRDIKAKQQPEVKEIEPVKERTVYVTVDAAVRKLQKEIAEN